MEEIVAKENGVEAVLDLKTLKVDNCGELEIMTSKFSKSQKTSSARDLHDTIQQPLFFLEKVQI